MSQKNPVALDPRLTRRIWQFGIGTALEKERGTTIFLKMYVQLCMVFAAETLPSVFSSSLLFSSTQPST